MEAGEPLGKDLVFERDFGGIMFWRYRSIIQRSKRLVDILIIRFWRLC